MGFTAYKIKVGIDTPEKDAARTREICRLLGGSMLISADANQGYSTEQALDYVRAVKGSGLNFFEQPVRPRACSNDVHVSMNEPLRGDDLLDATPFPDQILHRAMRP